MSDRKLAIRQLLKSAGAHYRLKVTTAVLLFAGTLCLFQSLLPVW